MSTRRPAVRRTGRTLAALLVTAALAAGCGATSGEGAAGGFEGELEAMPGVTDARVDREAFDTDYWGEEIVVDLAPDATAGHVAAVLDAFLARRRQTDGAPQQAHVTIGAGTTRSEGDRFAPDAPPLAVPAERPAGNARVARLLVAAVAAFPGHFVSVTPTDWSVTTAVEGADPRPGIDRMVEVVRDDPVLAGSRRLQLIATAGGAGQAGETRVASLDAYDGLTPQLVASWRELSSRVDLDVVHALRFGATSIHLDVRAGEDVRPRQLTSEAYGDRVWPTLHAALDALVAMPRSATLTVVNRYQVTDDGGFLEDRFLTTRPHLRTGRDRLGRTWHAEAAAYLARVCDSCGN